MMKTLVSLYLGFGGAALLAACATASPEDYLQSECADLRGLISAQNIATVQARDSYTQRNFEELEHVSGSPWAGRPRTRDDTKLRDERLAIRQAYRRKGCKA